MKLHSIEKYEAHRQALQKKVLVLACLGLLTSIAGSALITENWADRQLRNQLLQQAHLAMRVIDDDCADMAFDRVPDASSPAYLRLKERLMQIRQANRKFRFVYLLSCVPTPPGAHTPFSRNGRQLCFYADSEPVGSADYSPPGQVYNEATDDDWHVFEAKTELVDGPQSDRWGIWVSALIPILDPTTHEVKAALGLDVDAHTWRRAAFMFSLLPACLTTASIAGFFLLVHVLSRRSEKNLARQQMVLRENEERLKFAMEGANDGIFEIDLLTGSISLSPRGYEMLGYTGADSQRLDNRCWEKFVYPDDVPAMREALEAHQTDRTPGLCVEHRLKTASGGYLWALLRGKISARTPDGKPMRLTGTVTDITFRKHAEELQQKSQKEMARLLSESRRTGQALLQVVEEQKKTEAALTAERIRLASIIKATNVGTWEWNLLTGEVAINARWAEMLGYSESELAPVTYDTWFRLLHPDDREKIMTVVEQHVTGKMDFYVSEHRIKHKDGRWVWVLDSGSITSRAPDGKPLLMSGTHTDITLRKHSERYQQLSGTILLLMSGSDDFKVAARKIVEAIKNTTECDGVGLRLDAVAGTPLYETVGAKILLPGADTTPEGLDPARGAIAMEDAGVQSVATVPIRAETEVIGQLQLRSHAKNFFERHTLVALEEIGDRIGSALVRKRGETERKRLMAAIDQASEIIVITDTQGTIQYVNPAFVEITGYPRAEALGQTPRILKSGVHDAAFYRNMWDTLSSGKQWKGRLTNRRKNGTLYVEEDTISPVRNETGKIVYYVAVKRDISEHLQMSVQLIQAQKMESVGRLAGGVAHDFNNMLAVILGNTELALTLTNGSQPLTENLLEIRRAAECSTDLTKRLLAFARKQPVAPQVFDLTEAVGKILKMLQRLIGENIQIIWQPNAEELPVNMDPSQIDQIMTNLAINARDAITGAGRLSIETKAFKADSVFCSHYLDSKPGDFALLTVSDNGGGMNKKTLEHIFEPFFTTKEIGKGTGLGLATVYGIVKQSEGFIHVYSEPKMGATFKIYLPLSHARPSSVPVSSETSAQHGTETILMVEDESAILRMGRTMLESLGYRVITASKPSEALEWAKKPDAAFDLLLTDMFMPEMTGNVLVERMKKIRPAFKCLFMSGYTASMLDNQAIHEVALLPKPFSLNELAAKTREVLSRK